jgi:hypothetical protein
MWCIFFAIYIALKEKKERKRVKRKKEKKKPPRKTKFQVICSNYIPIEVW